MSHIEELYFIFLTFAQRESTFQLSICPEEVESMQMFLEGELIRPLKHATRTHWEAEVHPQEFREGGSTMVFHWVARSNSAIGAIGGDIVVMPDRKAILFRDRSESEWETYEDTETVLRRIALYQWGEPDHFDKVCASLQALEDGTSLEDVVHGWRQLDGVVSQ